MILRRSGINARVGVGLEGIFGSDMWRSLGAMERRIWPITTTTSRAVLRCSMGREIHCGLPVRQLHASNSYTTSTSTSTSTSTITTSPRNFKTAIFFPGQGVQRVGMLTNLQTLFPRTINSLLTLLDDTIATSDLTFPPPLPSSSTGKLRLSEIIAKGPADVLTQTENAQPAILFTSVCLLRVLEEELGLDLRYLASPPPGAPTSAERQLYFLGHSLGEFTSLVASRLLPLSTALHLVRRRGISMTTSIPPADRSDVGMFALLSPTPEHMASLIKALSPENLSTLAPTVLPKGKFVQIANHNTSTQIVVSGHVSAITSVLSHLREFSGHDPRAIGLKVSVPFHCPLMAPAVETVRRGLDGIEDRVEWERRMGEVVGNVTARPYGEWEEVKMELPRQATERVRWWGSVKWLDGEVGVERWVGFGPGTKVGKGLVGKEVKPEAEVVMVGEDMGATELEGIVRTLMG